MANSKTVSSRTLLLIGAVDLTAGRNHRFFHIANFVSNMFSQVDFITYQNPYGGSPTTTLKKISKTITNIFTDRKKIYQRSNVRYIIIRRLKMPYLFDQLFQGIWIFLNLKRDLNRQYEICIFGHPYNYLLATILKRLGIAKTWIYDDWDYFPGHVYQHGIFLRWITKFQEKISLRIPELVISVGDQLADLRRRQGAKNVRVIPNGVDSSFFHKARTRRRNHPPTLIYVGTLSFDWGIDLAIKSIPTIKERIPNIRLIIVGSGPDEEKLKLIASNLRVDKQTIFMNNKKYHELPDILASADIGLAPYRDKKFIQFASPLKIKEYAAAGLPIITTKIGEAKRVVKKFKIGELIGHSSSELANAVLELLNNHQKFAHYRKNAISCSNKFDWAPLLTKELMPLLYKNPAEMMSECSSSAHTTTH